VRAVVLRAFVTSVTLASSSMSSSPARAEDAPAPEHDEAAWAYPKRGLSFFPDGPGAADSYARRLRGRTDLQIAEDFLVHVRGSAPDDDERAVLQEAFEAVRAEDVGAERA